MCSVRHCSDRRLHDFRAPRADSYVHLCDLIFFYRGFDFLHDGVENGNPDTKKTTQPGRSRTHYPVRLPGDYAPNDASQAITASLIDFRRSASLIVTPWTKLVMASPDPTRKWKVLVGRTTSTVWRFDPRIGSGGYSGRRRCPFFCVTIWGSLRRSLLTRTRGSQVHTTCDYPIQR
ncbi:hypothetical protein BC834DRAFT_524216 [Gloeopeniophorella convolvens]|nr:hypothetical protein BC834DRAFT_524216 [Gloeopeniophorella convolvens]